MNDDYVIEPTAFKSAADIRYALEKFGFSEGRFVARFPQNWIVDFKTCIERFPDVERKRAFELLQKYKRRCCFVNTKQAFDRRRPWSENARSAQAVFAGAVFTSDSPTIADIDDDFFKPSREQRILAKTAEYSRISRRLIEASGEVFLIDPYFKISRPGRVKILNEFIKIGAAASCRSFHIFSRYTECIEGTEVSFDRIARREIKLQRGQRMHCHLVDDSGHINEMHARFLLALNGAIHFDKGFAEEPLDHYVDVSYVDRVRHAEYARLFIDGEHGFTLKHELVFSA